MKKIVVFLVLVIWTVSLPVDAFVCAESLSFLEGKIRVYAAQREDQYILIPFTRPPEQDVEILLLHNHTDISYLKRLKNETVLPKSMVNPHPHYVYGLAEGSLSGLTIQFLVAEGRAIKPLIKWKAAAVMAGDEMPTECMRADKGFTTEVLRVLPYEELNVKFYYLQEELIQSFNMMEEEDKNSAIWMKEIVGLVGPQGDCHVLAYKTSDAYGLHNTGTPEPVGPILGIMELSSESSTER